METIVVTGSRTWVNLLSVMDELQPYAATHQLHVGDARGADRIAAAVWRQINAVNPVIHRARWNRDGRYVPTAGFERNTEMLEIADPALVLAFRMPGKSNGTDHCIAEARRLGFIVRVIRP